MVISGLCPQFMVFWGQNSLEASVADLEGVQGVRSNPPLEPNYFVFMGNLKKF